MQDSNTNNLPDANVKANDAEIVHLDIPEDPGLQHEYDALMDSQNSDGEA